MEELEGLQWVGAPCYLLASTVCPASTRRPSSPPSRDLPVCQAASRPSWVCRALASLTASPASLYPGSILSTPGSSTGTGSLEVSSYY